MTGGVRDIAALAAALAIVGSAPAGGMLFAVAVVLAACVALLLLADAFAATGHRIVVPAAAIAAVGAPLRVAAVPDTELDSAAGLVVAALLASFVLLILGRRREGVALAVGATGACALLVGLGGAGLVALRGADGGFRWVAGLLALTLLPEIAAGATARLRPDAAAQGAARVVALGVVGGTLIAVANPPLGAPAAAVLAVAAGAAALGAETFTGAVASEARSHTMRPPFGAPQRWLLGVMAASPVVFLAARALQA